MGSFRLRHPPRWGYVRIAEPGLTPLSYLRFGILRLEAGSMITLTFPGEESVLVLLCGKGEMRWADQAVPVSRRDVFSDLATALYLPPQVSVSLSAESPMEWAAVHAPSDLELPPRLIQPADLRPRRTGGPAFERQIVELLGPDRPARYLLVGETITPGGNWSSYPPHKHDQDQPGKEAVLEEIYFYKITPPSGFAMQWIYTPDGALDHAVAVHSDDLVVIPRGYHPVAAPPGYDVYYLWAMAGERRALEVTTDPAHSWLLERYRLAGPR